MMCTYGTASASLVVVPSGQMLTPAVASANTADMTPVSTIPTFGTCSSNANPVVATASAAAGGTLTPMPCVPATASPWTPGITNVVNGSMPIVDSTCTLNCSYGGVISVVSPGQTTLIV